MRTDCIHCDYDTEQTDEGEIKIWYCLKGCDVLKKCDGNCEKYEEERRGNDTDRR